ncbi:PREDICTED: pentatricopeptide repeat-containing protein At1g52640, mitochondrial [Tarenaya hassleriana]|uniref:pentatricopeptide repeat-containing protein At1g52640, mitochondrial n=1 Tax=Tarenaya hassleriana TaxID=28532 RepID=UPI00053C825F|nr:PREDICTED: pentatricopeptide repeat-containing protein At1g52640, mitochondrial [Tarenaya hassleriana]
MAIRAFSCRTRNTLSSSVLRALQNSRPQHIRLFCCVLRDPPSLVNEISRVLSDHRNPQDDLEHALHPYSSRFSSNLVEQVLKRCKNLGFSAHRFFLWARRIPDFEHSLESCHILVEILGSSKQFALLWDFLLEAREYNYFEITPKFFWIVFRAYSRANLPSEAIRAFNRMVEFGIKPTVNDLDQLLHSLCDRRHVKHAHEFFDKVKHGFEPSAKSYSILVRGLGNVRDAPWARKVFDEMLERGCPIDLLAYNSLLHTLCRSGDVSGAYTMFQEMGKLGFRPDAYSYSIFIRAYCDANDIHSVFRVLDRMKRYDLVPNVFTYNHIVKTLCQNEKVDDAYSLLDEMTEKGAIPDTWTYNSIMSYHCEHCEVNQATKLISRMEKHKCSPDKHTYNMLLKLLIRIGRFDRATEIWEGMGEKGFYPSVGTYSVMVHGLVRKKGKLEEACKYFETMIDEGIPPYGETVEMMRKRLVGRGLMEVVDVLAGKMERSSSCSIREMAKEMRGKRSSSGLRNEEDDSEFERESHLL